MQVPTILNRVTHYKPFVFEKAELDEAAGRMRLRVRVRARANGQAVCDGCGRRRPGYDRLPERTWEFAPLWQIAVFFVYARRRVDCPPR